MVVVGLVDILFVCGYGEVRWGLGFGFGLEGVGRFWFWGLGGRNMGCGFSGNGGFR